MNNIPSLDWLENPEIFRVNRIDAHSDHLYYEKEEDISLGYDMPLRQYLNGKCLFILYSIASFYIVLAIINVVVHKKDFLLIQRASIYFYGSATLAAVVYQAIFPTVLVTCFFMSISSMMIFLSIVNPGNFIDKEMDVLNTDAFIEVATEYTVTKPSFRVLGIQIIGLKYLNDT